MINLFKKLKAYFSHKSIYKEQELECPICLESLKHTKQKDIHITTCKHVFHRKCINEWTCKRPYCPLCRNKLTRPNNKIYNASIFISNFSIVTPIIVERRHSF